MVFNSRVIPVFMLWLPKISGSSITIISTNISTIHVLFSKDTRAINYTPDSLQDSRVEVCLYVITLRTVYKIPAPR